MANDMPASTDHHASSLEIMELKMSIEELKQEIRSLRTQKSGANLQPNASTAPADSHELVAIALREMKAKGDEVERLNGENAILRVRIADLETQVPTDTEGAYLHDDGVATGARGRGEVNQNGKRTRNNGLDENGDSQRTTRRQRLPGSSQNDRMQAENATKPQTGGVESGGRRGRSGNNNARRTDSAQQATLPDLTAQDAQSVELPETHLPAGQTPGDKYKGDGGPGNKTKAKRKPGRPARRSTGLAARQGVKASADVGDRETEGGGGPGGDGGASRSTVSANDEIANSTDVPSSNPVAYQQEQEDDEQQQRQDFPPPQTESAGLPHRGPQSTITGTEAGAHDDTAPGGGDTSGKADDTAPLGPDARAKQIAARDRMAKKLMERAEAEAEASTAARPP